MDQLVGTAEIAERLHLAHSETIHNWRKRYEDFPQPIAQLKMGVVWDWRDVQKWAKDTGRLPQAS